MSASDRWGRRTALAAWLLAMACSEGTTPTGPTTGSLLVTINGLAAGTSAAVTVTGPAGFTRTLTATETLSALAPGSYTIAAANVSAGNYTHQPTPASQAVAVAASTTPATATVTYAPSDGALTVTVSGLPVGANAAVNVTGPSGFAREVTTTTTLTALAPGGYRVNASAVTSGVTTYAPASAAQNLTVAAGATATATVAYSSSLIDLLIWGGSLEPPSIMTETFSDTACAVVEGLVQSGTRRLMRFGIEVRNAGTADLVFGDPAGNPLFAYAPCHGHYHFDDFALYRLVDGSGQTVGTGLKVGFCLVDYSRWDPSANPNPRFNFEECNPQGIQAGWGDVYGSFLDGQWVDITSVPAGPYTLELTVDPENRIAESDETNNVLRVQVTIPPPGSTASLATRSAGRNRSFPRPPNPPGRGAGSPRGVEERTRSRR